MAMKIPEDEILKAIEKSGYLMEQEIATTLEEMNFNVKTNASFEDEEEGKSREIDILAPQELFRDEEKKLTIYTVLICECKNNQNPFVFIKRKKNKYDLNPAPIEYLFPVEKYWKHTSKDGYNFVSDIPPFQFLELKKSHYYYKTEDKAVQFCKIIRKGKNWEAMHDNIYDGIFYPLIKALNSQIKYVKKFKREWKHIYLFFPMVVLNSEIYAIQSYDSVKKPVLVDSVSFVREIKSKTINGQYLVDFITKEKLKNHINNKILKFCNSIVEDYKSNPNKYLERDIKE